MRIRRGTTPTIKLTLNKKNESDPEIDLSIAEDIYVTFSKTYQIKLFDKKGDDLEIDGNDIYIYLTQEETLGLKEKLLVQVNWTYIDDLTHKKKRASSTIKSISMDPNLLNEVI